MNKNISKIWRLALLIIVFSFACNKSEKKQSTIIASVGKSTLTLADLKKSLPQNPGFEISSMQVQKFITRWIESELVYQEALKQGINKSADVKDRLSELQKNYLVAAYLDKMVDEKVVVNNEEIDRFYSANSEEFVRSDDYYNIRLMLVEKYSEANSIRSKIAKGEDFGKLARKHSLDDSAENGGELGWVRLSGLPNDLAKVVPYVGVKAVSRPIKTAVGRYLVDVLDVRKKGQTQTLEEVRDEIIWRLKAQKREDLYRRLITILGENVVMKADWAAIHIIISDSLTIN